MYPWTIPDEMVHFISRQFIRFNAPYPVEKAVDIIGDKILEYVAKEDYFPHSPSEALWRYDHPSEGMTEFEKRWIVAPIEILVKRNHLIDISFEQIHLCAWSALLWCWSEEGESYVRFVKQT